MFLTKLSETKYTCNYWATHSNVVFFPITAGGRFDLRLEFEGHIIKFYRSMVSKLPLLIPEMDSETTYHM